MREYLFDDFNSVLHLLIGLAVALLGRECPVLGTITILIYVVYEVFEIERSVATVGDIVEFAVGFMIGALWW